MDNLTIDGYSQLGSKPSSNGILGGNNANIQIVPRFGPVAGESIRITRISPSAVPRDFLYSGYSDFRKRHVGSLSVPDGFRSQPRVHRAWKRRAAPGSLHLCHCPGQEGTERREDYGDVGFGLKPGMMNRQAKEESP